MLQWMVLRPWLLVAVKTFVRSSLYQMMHFSLGSLGCQIRYSFITDKKWCYAVLLHRHNTVLKLDPSAIVNCSEIFLFTNRVCVLFLRFEAWYLLKESCHQSFTF